MKRLKKKLRTIKIKDEYLIRFNLTLSYRIVIMHLHSNIHHSEKKSTDKGNAQRTSVAEKRTWNISGK